MHVPRCLEDDVCAQQFSYIGPFSSLYAIELVDRDYSSDLRKLVFLMLSPAPMDRPTADEVQKECHSSNHQRYELDVEKNKEKYDEDMLKAIKKLQKLNM